MALLLLMTTTSFTIAVHFCGDTLVDLALNDKANSCSMQSVDLEMQDLMRDMGCCNDHQILSTGDHDLLKSQSTNEIPAPFAVIPVAISVPDYDVYYRSFIDGLFVKEIPPLPREPLFILHDSFLI